MRKIVVLFVFVTSVSAFAFAATPNELLALYSTQAAQSANAARGEVFFKANHGQQWRCTSCHTTAPSAIGRHASTDKPIEPLAPSANPLRLTDSAKVEKWLRRNCKDVVARECTAIEKADVLAWLINFR